MSDPTLVSKLAELSRLDISEDEKETFGKEFEGILAYVSALESLELDPSVVPEAGDLRNVFRQDGEPHESGAYTQKIVDAFPEKEGNSLKVKQILSHD